MQPRTDSESPLLGATLQRLSDRPTTHAVQAFPGLAHTQEERGRPPFQSEPVPSHLAQSALGFLAVCVSCGPKGRVASRQVHGKSPHAQRMQRRGRTQGQDVAVTHRTACALLRSHALDGLRT